MDFISNREPQIRQMLDAMGVEDVEALFRAIPADLRVQRPSVDDGLSEMEGMREMEAIASRNQAPSMDCYLGAGAYEHHVPPVVAALCQKSAFLTAYTPYQAEASQGGLQVIFEFQSAICALTGMDVANASVYDGASACAEAVLMCLRQKKRARRVLVAGTLNPMYRGVVDRYLSKQDIEIVTIPFNSEGNLDLEAYEGLLGDDVACVLLQSPNFFGVMESARQIFDRAKDAGAISILCANPMSYGIYASAGSVGADIAVGDVQPFGVPLQFGGPYVGYVACKEALLRQLPGRIVGETVDSTGRRGFVLTLQAREQHIRREKATSNICSNQALAAMASLIGILWYGKKGVTELALTNFQRACFLREKMLNLPGVEAMHSGTQQFNEFVLRFDQPLDEVVQEFRSQGIQPGVPLEPYYPELAQHMLIAVTETKTLSQLERYLDVAEKAACGSTHHI